MWLRVPTSDAVTHGTWRRFLAMGSSLSEFLENQRREALGSVNKWYCSQFHGYEVNDPEVLLAYYIRHGGALHFRREHEQINTVKVQAAAEHKS